LFDVAQKSEPGGGQVSPLRQPVLLRATGDELDSATKHSLCGVTTYIRNEIGGQVATSSTRTFHGSEVVCGEGAKAAACADSREAACRLDVSHHFASLPRSSWW